MIELRCKNCYRLLAKAEQFKKIEIKCKCKTLNTYKNENN